MKIRTGFVANSSSCSFVAALGLVKSKDVIEFKKEAQILLNDYGIDQNIDDSYVIYVVPAKEVIDGDFLLDKELETEFEINRDIMSLTNERLDTVIPLESIEEGDHIFIMSVNASRFLNKLFKFVKRNDKLKMTAIDNYIERI